jgi:protease I
MTKDKKIGILLENRFLDYEISYYQHRFAEDGLQVDFLTRLWGQPQLTFKGLELGMQVTVDKSFEAMSDAELRSYGAIIVPSGYVADMLRYAENPGDLPPAVDFMRRAMAEKEILKGCICHSLWIFDHSPETIRGRKVTCHNNIIGSVRNAGALYVDQDLVVDGDLVTARTGGMFARFARTIIDLVVAFQ